MDKVFQYLLENSDTLILSLCVILSNFLGSPKTAEEISQIKQKKKDKKQARLIRRTQKLAYKVEKNTQAIEDIEKGGS